MIESCCLGEHPERPHQKNLPSFRSRTALMSSFDTLVCILSSSIVGVKKDWSHQICSHLMCFPWSSSHYSVKVFLACQVSDKTSSGWDERIIFDLGSTYSHSSFWVAVSAIRTTSGSASHSCVSGCWLSPAVDCLWLMTLIQIINQRDLLKVWSGSDTLESLAEVFIHWRVDADLLMCKDVTLLVWQMVAVVWHLCEHHSVDILEIYLGWFLWGIHSFGQIGP